MKIAQYAPCCLFDKMAIRSQKIWDSKKYDVGLMDMGTGVHKSALLVTQARFSSSRNKLWI